ncbi:MAG: glycosyltransferase family 2 protein [Bacteroidetes bacterium]|nr:MAG: glycosyltransferase family 2 protein [Bacteroidota bacterium]
MINDKTVAVVVPAYNEETQIETVIETMPDFVDRIIVVNDCSKDKTADVVKELISKQKPATQLPEKKGKKKNRYTHAEEVADKINLTELKYFASSEVINENPETDRVILINLLKNSGVGAAIARGYKWCKDNNIDISAVMAGDGQMDPDELIDICKPVADEGIDYVKGNRLIHRSAWLVIPKVRFFGNSILSILTKVASGYWHVSDTQTGYTAISKKALNSIRLYDIYKSYGMPNDMLVKLNIAFCTLKEVEIKPIYDVGEKSKMKVMKVIPRISWLLFKAFFKRLWIKYLFRDFHPLFLLYNLSIILFLASLPFAVDIIEKVFTKGASIVSNNLIVFIFLVISSFQSLLFAMWMDIQDNDRLYKS